jgi:hypothetical protein
MDGPSPEVILKSPWRLRMRVCRPLLWWALLMLALLGLRAHERMSKKTYLKYEVTLDGSQLSAFALMSFDIIRGQPSVSVDGQPVSSGERISIGKHNVRIFHPKAETISTNIFVWYGLNDLGTIALTRTKGTVILESKPLAMQLMIRGPEFSEILSNSVGKSFSIPTDEYVVSAKYAHWQEEKTLTVESSSKTIVAFSPRLGSLALECNKSAATFQLVGDAATIGRGALPAEINDLREGRYTLVTFYRNHKRQQPVFVDASSTNRVRIDLAYGAAFIETDPPGAMVLDREGNESGKTPLLMPELEPGESELTLRLAGYETVKSSLRVSANQTNTFRTNLVNTSYATALRNARDYFTAKDYTLASDAASRALQIVPGDEMARAIIREASAFNTLRRAQDLGSQRKYGDALKMLRFVSGVLPDNDEVKKHVADYTQRQREAAEQVQEERSKNAKNVFRAMFAKYPDAAAFELHDLNVGGLVTDAAPAISNALGSKRECRVVKHNTLTPETFAIEANYDLKNNLGGIVGRVQCLAVGAQTTDRESEIHFKLLDYKAEAAIKFSIGALIPATTNVNYILIPPSNKSTSEKLQSELREAGSWMQKVITNSVSHLTVRETETE